MPQPGETITEGTIVNWLVSAGESIQEGQYIVELETEKALFEYESPFTGTLIEITENNGATVPIGNPIAVFEVEDSRAAQYFMLGLGKEAQKKIAPSLPAPQKKSSSAETKVQIESNSKPTSKKSSTPLKLSPFVRRLIKEHGIDLDELNQLQGTGPKQRITKEDILRHLETRTRTDSLSVESHHKSEKDFDIIPCSPVRSRIADNMLVAKQTIPHAHTNVSVDMTRLVDYRKQMKEEFQQKHGIPLSITTLIFPTLQKAVANNPLVNSSFKEEGDRKFILQYKKLNLAMAAGTDKGLFLPVIHRVENDSMIEFAHKLEGVLDRAQNQKLTVEDLTGMTFTFNNFGYFGTQIGVQIILPPQAATLGMGKIEPRPWVVGEAIKIRQIADFTLTFDHRVMDGREAGLFLQAIKKGLEEFSL